MPGGKSIKAHDGKLTCDNPLALKSGFFLLHQMLMSDGCYRVGHICQMFVADMRLLQWLTVARDANVTNAALSAING